MHATIMDVNAAVEYVSQFFFKFHMVLVASTMSAKRNQLYNIAFNHLQVIVGLSGIRNLNGIQFFLN